MKNLTTKTHEELQALRAKVAHRREYLDILELELFNTRAMLQEFTNVYNQRISPLEHEYQRLEQLLEREIDYSDRPPADRKQQKGQQASGAGNGKGPQPPPNTKYSKKMISRDPEFEQQIRELFHNLAKRFHPDLAGAEDDKAQREKIMAQINEAYTTRDLGTLQSLATMARATANGNSGPAAELASLKIELRNLEAMIFEVEHTIREIDNSPAMQMRTDMNIETQSGRDLMADLESSLRERIQELRGHLLDLGLDPKLIYMKKP